ncbi:MAG: hypothetical protein IJE22_08855 [Oscillibacter sp.]|nr:hypothetical protein [Oscillibacter sp.]
MIKKVFFALAVCAALITSAAAADLTRQEAEAGIRENVSAMVQSYAAAVYQPNAASEAFDDFFIHGFWGGGKTMAVNERSPIIASLFNACVMQEALVEGISRGIARMQELQQDTLYLNGGPGWHNYGYSYSYFGYLAEEKDLTRSINTIVSAKDLYGDSLYTGPRTGNDEVMELLVGGLEGGILLRLQEVKGDTAFYTVEFRIGDIFDFDGDYKKISDKGYNVGRDKLLNNLGFLLTLFGLDKFDWSFTKILTVEVPYRTAVEGGNYRWVYDSDDLTLHSDGENGFLFNEATGTAYENAEGNVTKHYFQLDRPVVLRHDRPWVVQYDQMPYRSFVLAPAVNSNTCLPLLYQNGKSYTWFYAYDRHNLTAEEEAAGITSSYDSHYVGAEILGRFKYSSKRLYTYQLENIIAEDGSNMIWLSVFDHTLGRRVFGPTALDTHWRKSKGETDHTLVGTGSTMVSGENIIINYIGNKSVRITDPTTAPVTLDLRIYTNGTDDVLNWEDAAPTIEGKVTGHSGMSVNTVKDGVETAQKVNKSGSFSFQPDGKCDVVFRAPGCLTVTVKDVPGTGYYTFGTIALPQGDVNGDERINMQDLRIFLQNFNKTEEAIGEALTDVTEDGRVNMEDLRAFLQNFNKSAEGCTKVYEE